MKKSFIVLLAMATVIGTSTGHQFGGEYKENVVYASNEQIGELDKNPTEKFNAEFAYQMAQITAKIVTAPTTNVENFKAEFAYATAQVTAKVMPIIPSGQRNEFAYEMARITTKIIIDQNLDVEKAKAEFTYEIAQLTSKIITNADQITTGKKTLLKVNNDYIEPKTTSNVNNTDTYQNVKSNVNNIGTYQGATSNVNNTGTYQGAKSNVNNTSTYQGTTSNVNNTGIYQRATLLRNNADIEPKAKDKANNTDTYQKEIANTGYIAPETYNGLINELMQVGDRKHVDNKVNIDGEIRYHYRLNNGPERWDRNSSGIRVRLGFDTKINKDWTAYGMLEGQKSLVDYNNEYNLSRLYVAGKLGTTMLTAGSFGYLMAEGNIYDSDFKGVRADFEGPIKYTVSSGKTDYTKDTSIVTARYNDFDYNLEAGIYHNKMNNGDRNTIWTLGGNYNFSNFGVGAMYLGSSLKDSKGNSNGYVLSFNYGDLKTYRPGTYNIFAKYYNQPMNTYIAHGMNGIGSWMQGFKGYGLGVNYTLAENFIVGLEYYDLKDKITGEKGETWWNQLTYYF